MTQWKHLDLRCLNPSNWGWRIENKLLEPVKTDLDPAPAWLLQVVRCNCKINTRRPCGSRSCSCRKNGLDCVPACGGCHGEGCENSAEPIQETENQNDDDNERNIFDMLESFL